MTGVTAFVPILRKLVVVIRSVPEFEIMSIRLGIQLIKYWFSITETAGASIHLPRS